MSRLRKGWGALAVTAIVAGGVAQGASALPSPQADYQFHNDLSSSIAGAPPMTDLGSGNGFATENVDGCMTRVLSFPQHNGLTLDTSGLSLGGPPFDVRVVLDFRLADVSGFRRLIQTTDPTSDSGLYVHDGKLDWYQAGSHEGGPVIASNQFVEVHAPAGLDPLAVHDVRIRQRGASSSSFTTPDSTEVGPQLRLFKDNVLQAPPTRTRREKSSASGSTAGTGSSRRTYRRVRRGSCLETPRVSRHRRVRTACGELPGHGSRLQRYRFGTGPERRSRRRADLGSTAITVPSGKSRRSRSSSASAAASGSLRRES